MNEKPVTRTGWRLFFGALATTEDIIFATDMIRNVFWFLVIGLVAVGLGHVVQILEDRDENHFIIIFLIIVKYAMFAVDLVWFLSRLLIGVYRVYVDTRKSISELNYALKNKHTPSDE